MSEVVPSDMVVEGLGPDITRALRASANRPTA